MPFTKEELRYLKAALERDIKHLKKDKKSIAVPEGIRFEKGEVLLEKFQKDLLKKISKMLK
jgi:hypothetical protein